jgi:Zn-dependent protease
MQTEIRLGRCYGLAWTTRSSAFAGTAALWAILAIAAATLLKTTWAAAIALGLAAALLHWLSETWHQLGHAWAARRTGHPMTGVRFWGVLSTSVYPADEGPLPARMHVRRALGGPAASLLLTLVAGGIALALRETSVDLRALALFFFLENLFVFTLQALVPLGFNDGATLWHWLRAAR